MKSWVLVKIAWVVNTIFDCENRTSMLISMCQKARRRRRNELIDWLPSSMENSFANKNPWNKFQIFAKVWTIDDIVDQVECICGSNLDVLFKFDSACVFLHQLCWSSCTRIHTCLIIPIVWTVFNLWRLSTGDQFGRSFPAFFFSPPGHQQSLLKMISLHNFAKCAHTLVRNSVSFATLTVCVCLYPRKKINQSINQSIHIFYQFVFILLEGSSKEADG